MFNKEKFDYINARIKSLERLYDILQNDYWAQCRAHQLLLKTLGLK